MPEKENYFVIIDGNSIVHRSFHALPPLTRSDGTIVNAVYGFLLVLFYSVFILLRVKCIFPQSILPGKFLQ